MGPHVGLDVRGAANCDRSGNRRRQIRRSFDILFEEAIWRRRAIGTTNHDQAVFGKANAVGKLDGSFSALYRLVVKVRCQVRVVADYFQTGLAINQGHDFATQRREWKVRVRSETALACDADSSFMIVLERGRDLGAGGIELRAGAFYLPAEGSETIRIEVTGHTDIKPKSGLQKRFDDLLLAMHGRENSPFA